MSKNRVFWIGFSVLAGFSGFFVLFFGLPKQTYAQTPIPTGTPIAPGIISATGELTYFLTIPQPLEIPTSTLSETLEVTTLWDIPTITYSLRIARTQFEYPIIKTFLNITITFAGLLAAMKIISNLLIAYANWRRSGADEV